LAEPRVAVVVPAWNAARYLGEALASVFAQTLRPAEVVVVDDGSTDETASVAASVPGVTVIRQANAGPAAARNRGVRETVSPLIAFLDADDLWLAAKLASQADAIARGADLVTAATEEFVSPDLSDDERARIAPPRAAGGALPSAMLVTRSAFERAGPLREDLRVAEFVEWFDRARAGGARVQHLDAVLVRRRLHPGNAGRRPGIDRSGYATALRAVLARRRARGETA
jgi:glycosyltransferase involved in cell wall biosynthesis